jgi:hypothetical protein
MLEALRTESKFCFFASVTVSRVAVTQWWNCFPNSVSLHLSRCQGVAVTQWWNCFPNSVSLHLSRCQGVAVMQWWNCFPNFVSLYLSQLCSYAVVELLSKWPGGLWCNLTLCSRGRIKRLLDYQVPLEQKILFRQNLLPWEDMDDYMTDLLCRYL